MGEINYEFVKIDRQHVTLRIPTDIVEAVEDYAEKNHLRKTDAYVHFLRCGLEGSSSMAQLEQKIDTVIDLLQVRN